MSSVAGDGPQGTRQATTSDDHGTKSSKPDLFYGERNKLNNWLMQLDLYFRYSLKGTKPEDRVPIATTFMRGKVQTWIAPDLQKYLDGDMYETETQKDGTKRRVKSDECTDFEDYGKFKKRIRAVFGPANEKLIAESVIQRLKQTKSAADYATTFQHFAAQTNWDDEAQMSMFKRGLRDDVQDELMRYGGSLDDMEDLTRAAIEMDDKLHQRRVEKQENKGRFTGPVSISHYGERYNSYQRNRRDRGARDYEQGDPMELDVMTPKSNGRGPQQPDQRKCYSCGKLGHIARNCRSKNMVHRPQLNVLRRLPQESDSELLLSDPEDDSDVSSFTLLEDAQRPPSRVSQTQLATPPEYEDEEETPLVTPEGNCLQCERVDDAIKNNHWNMMSYLRGDHRPGCDRVQKVSKSDETRCYAMDTRNLVHDTVHWSFCFHDYCLVHQSAKINSGYFPKMPTTLKCEHHGWEQCTDDRCASHLVDKRRNEHFPGHTESWYLAWKTAKTRIEKKVGNDCCQGWAQHLTHFSMGEPLWQRCLMKECFDHSEAKKRFGFLQNTPGLNNINLKDAKGQQYTNSLAIPVRIGEETLVALIDTGACRSFMSRQAAETAFVKIRTKREPYRLAVATGKDMPGINAITTETELTQIAIRQHREVIKFDILEMATHDIILGMPWLKKHNPVVDWVTKQLRFKGGITVNAWKPREPRTRVMDENTSMEYRGMYVIQDSQKDRNETPSAPVTTQQGSKREGNQELVRDDRAHDSPQIQRNTSPPWKWTKERILPPKIKLATVHESKSYPYVLKDLPEPYMEYLHLFLEEKDKSKALPKHQPWDHQVPLMEGKQPTFGPIYQLSEKELQELDAYLKENLAKGFIRPSSSSAGYPILFVPKKNGKLRLCVDYRKLNEITIKNRYPLPNSNELRDRLQGAQFFTKLDMRGAYNLIRMKEGHEWKTAFRTRYGLYEYMVMPFGLTNAPASCQELVNNVLRNLLDQCVIAYLDDILIYSKTLDQHIRDVLKVLKCLDEVHLKLEPEKCEFHKQEVPFLGYIVTTNGLRQDPEKVKSILEWPAPTNVKEVQSFLGVVNFNRKFIQGFSEIALPLTRLTRKDTEFSWANEQEQAFNKLKTEVTKEPTLMTFQPGKPIRIETDASDTAIGACLLQQKDQKWHPVAYHSKKMTDTEQNYDIHDKELLAIVDAFQQWRVYAEGASDTEVFTDHKNLIYFTTTKQLNRRQVRWAELLGQYKFKITYTPGKDNQVADSLSRRQDLYQQRSDDNRAIFEKDSQGNLMPLQQLNVLTFKPQDDFETSIKQQYQYDDLAIKWLREGQTTPLSYKGKLYVPGSLINELIRNHHDNPKYGHPGIARTYEIITRNYGAPSLKASVERFVNDCPACSMNKHESHAKYGYLQKIKLPDIPWASLTMDFMTSLPPSEEPSTKEIYDSILVVVDRYTKYMTILPFNKKYDATQLAYIFIDRIVRIRGFPKEVISDRDKLFRSAYWKTIAAENGVKSKLSTAYHPETDGQTERANRTIRQYLRHYITNNQTNWVQLLPIAELALNNLVSSATGTTPFFANFGRHPNLMDTPLNNPRSQKAITYASELHYTHEQIMKRLEQSQLKMEKYENQKRRKGPQLKEGDKVYLNTKNLKTKKPNKKLDHVKDGPFRIKTAMGIVNYELELPAEAKIHPVFHVSLLEKAPDHVPVATTFAYEPEEEEVYEVEKILQQNKDQYLVKWKGYPDSENTWEPVEHLLPSCANLLRNFRQQARQTGIPRAATRSNL